MLHVVISSVVRKAIPVLAGAGFLAFEYVDGAFCGMVKKELNIANEIELRAGIESKSIVVKVFRKLFCASKEHVSKGEIERMHRELDLLNDAIMYAKIQLARLQHAAELADYIEDAYKASRKMTNDEYVSGKLSGSMKRKLRKDLEGCDRLLEQAHFARSYAQCLGIEALTTIRLYEGLAESLHAQNKWCAVLEYALRSQCIADANGFGLDDLEDAKIAAKAELSEELYKAICGGDANE